MEFAAIQAGPFTANEVKVEGDRQLVLEGADGSAVGVIRKEHPLGGIKGKLGWRKSADPPSGTLLESAQGSWVVRREPGLTHGKALVLDGSGTQVAALERTSHSTQAFRLGTGDLVWESHTMRPQYRVEGLFSASRTAGNKFVPGLAKRPFKGDLTEALATHPDGSLVLLLAAYCTKVSIDAKVVAQSTD
jgi:hypothetical protein